jgi:uncharacterized protein
MKAMIIPGNGGSLITDNWFSDVKNGLENLGVNVVAENMPDPELARKEFWIPFIESKELGDDAILIGHSSGAVAILKYLEINKCKLAILVGVYASDLGDEGEKASHYFDEPWKWEIIKNNVEKVIIFASKDDPYIPISQPQFIKDIINAEYHEYLDEGHFGSDVYKTEFPEIVLAVKNNI